MQRQAPPSQAHPSTPPRSSSPCLNRSDDPAKGNTHHYRAGPVTTKAFVLLHLSARPHFRAPRAPVTEAVSASSPSLLPALRTPTWPGAGQRRDQEGPQGSHTEPSCELRASLARLKITYDENKQTNKQLFKAPESGPKGQQQRDVCSRKPAKVQ